jgi:predicted  nucleic acid-binding Zn-ribbon protein
MAEPKTTSAPIEPAATEEAVKNTIDLDDLSLTQALLDVDVANARVIDLTKRLTVLTKELRETTTALQKVKVRNARLSAELKQIKDSRAYRTAGGAQRALGAVRSRLGR